MLCAPNVNFPNKKFINFLNGRMTSTNIWMTQHASSGLRFANAVKFESFDLSASQFFFLFQQGQIYEWYTRFMRNKLFRESELMGPSPFPDQLFGAFHLFQKLESIVKHSCMDYLPYIHKNGFGTFIHFQFQEWNIGYVFLLAMGEWRGFQIAKVDLLRASVTGGRVCVRSCQCLRNVNICPRSAVQVT